MNDSKNKITRVGPLIKVRKAQLDREAASLAKVRAEKKEIIDKLSACQNQYMQGVENLNNERQSLSRDLLPALESSVDHAKQIWYETVKDLRIKEQEEREQIHRLLEAELNLSSAKKLKERYEFDFQAYESKQEQNFQDEVAIRKHITGNRRT